MKFHEQNLYIVYLFDWHKSDSQSSVWNPPTVMLYFQIWCSHYTPEYAQQAILTDVHSIAKYR